MLGDLDLERRDFVLEGTFKFCGVGVTRSSLNRSPEAVALGMGFFDSDDGAFTAYVNHSKALGSTLMSTWPICKANIDKTLWL